jgi:hypothetical protein
MNQPPNRRILLIDDTPSIHDDFRKILMPTVETNQALDDLESALFGDTDKPEVQAFELHSAYGGEEGLQLLSAAMADKRPYALAFVDMFISSYEKAPEAKEQQLLAFYMAYRNGVKGYLIDKFKKKFLKEAKSREDELYRRFVTHLETYDKLFWTFMSGYVTAMLSLKVFQIPNEILPLATIIGSFLGINLIIERGKWFFRNSALVVVIEHIKLVDPEVVFPNKDSRVKKNNRNHCSTVHFVQELGGPVDRWSKSSNSN